jgi:HEPN domain-containing protein
MAPAMNSDHAKWMNQAQKDLIAAQALVTTSHFEWACFVASQAAEKALKACLSAMELNWESRGRDGHDLIGLTKLWPNFLRTNNPDLKSALTELIPMVVNTRYPHARIEPDGQSQALVAPMDVFREVQAVASVRNAQVLVDFFEKFISEKLPALAGIMRTPDAVVASS